MNKLQNFDWAKNWVKICLFNLLIVVTLGTLMRYKIGFEFPYFNQKNLQHAHSHFAFAGWISQVLMVLMVLIIAEKLNNQQLTLFKKIFIANFICALGMLFSFPVQGYGLFSIFFSTVSIIIAFIFAWYYCQAILPFKNLQSRLWFLAALLFNVISTAGTCYLTYMMASKNLVQHHYLASIYWYLHFQYNGWFFFACIGLFIDFLQRNNLIIKDLKMFFWLFAYSCLPAYGLSVLWLELPIFMYILVVIAAILQGLAWINFLLAIDWQGIKKILASFDSFLLAFAGIALSIKILLQMGSTIPFLSQLAFGFRPIVIAYLHLVLLAFTTVFLLAYLHLQKIMTINKTTKNGLLLFVIGIFLTEFVLAIQGIASFSYTVVPFVNEILFVISVFMLVAMLLVNNIFGIHKS